MRSWIREDDILTLELYLRRFWQINFPADCAEVKQTAQLIGCSAAGMTMRLKNCRSLYTGGGLEHAVQLIKTAWKESGNGDLFLIVKNIKLSTTRVVSPRR